VDNAKFLKKFDFLSTLTLSYIKIYMAQHDMMDKIAKSSLQHFGVFLQCTLLQIVTK